MLRHKPVELPYNSRTHTSQNEGHRLRSIPNSRICENSKGSNKCLNLLVYLLCWLC